jgi:hypothetical protein
MSAFSYDERYHGEEDVAYWRFIERHMRLLRVKHPSMSHEERYERSKRMWQGCMCAVGDD